MWVTSPEAAWGEQRHMQTCPCGNHISSTSDCAEERNAIQAALQDICYLGLLSVRMLFQCGVVPHFVAVAQVPASHLKGATLYHPERCEGRVTFLFRRHIIQTGVTIDKQDGTRRCSPARADCNQPPCCAHHSLQQLNILKALCNKDPHAGVHPAAHDSRLSTDSVVTAHSRCR